MKTLEQIEQEITHYGNARYTEAEWFEDVDKCAKHTSRWRDVGNKILYPLLDSLAAWDAVVREALPNLELEYESLQDENDGTGSDEGLKTRVGHALTWELTATGLARLEYLRGILGEGEE